MEDMEINENDAISDSLDLNPELFINEVLNSVDDFFDGAFEFFHQEASEKLKTNGTDRSADLKKGVNYIQNTIQDALDKKLEPWKKYCLRHCFAAPTGLSLPDVHEPDGNVPMGEDALIDQQLDAQLDSLRKKLTEVEKESAELNFELTKLDLSAWSDSHAASVKEVLELYEQYSANDLFPEVIQTASTLQSEVEKLKTKGLKQNDLDRISRVYNEDIDLHSSDAEKDLLDSNLDDLQAFYSLD